MGLVTTASWPLLSPQDFRELDYYETDVIDSDLICGQGRLTCRKLMQRGVFATVSITDGNSDVSTVIQLYQT